MKLIIIIIIIIITTDNLCIVLFSIRNELTALYTITQHYANNNTEKKKTEEKNTCKVKPEKFIKFQMHS